MKIKIKLIPKIWTGNDCCKLVLAQQLEDRRELQQRGEVGYDEFSSLNFQ